MKDGQARRLPPGSFFFSIRRRHTRWPRDWISDVCFSDLKHERPGFLIVCVSGSLRPEYEKGIKDQRAEQGPSQLFPKRSPLPGQEGADGNGGCDDQIERSEERRVGKCSNTLRGRPLIRGR